MAILTCTKQQMLTLAGKKPTTYRGERARGQIAAAFGAAEPVLASRALVVDALALCIVDDLAERVFSDGSHGRRFAAYVVRGYFDKWIEAVSRIEHNEEAIVFVLSETDPRVTGRTEWNAAVGPAEKLPQLAETLHGLRQMTVVNVGQIMDDIKQRAVKAKLDLTVGSFFLPADHALFIEWTSDFRRWREEAFAREGGLTHSGRVKWPTMNQQQHRAILMQSLAIH